MQKVECSKRYPKHLWTYLKHDIPWFFSGNGIVSLSLLSRFRISRISLWIQRHTNCSSSVCKFIFKSRCGQCTSLYFEYPFPQATAPEESRWERRIGLPGWERPSFRPPSSPTSAQSLFLWVQTETAALRHRQQRQLRHSQNSKWMTSLCNTGILMLSISKKKNHQKMLDLFTENAQCNVLM